ncbi:AtaL-like protein [Goodfellowiella coeruleoviolacea]|uniref:AtaL-like protein n=1 Tax=Goodfellowiella coeruleoviolacea TaxID=334858 RepID=UPI00389907CD
MCHKAENAVPYVPAMSECTVVERSDNALVREVVLNGERVREAVTFQPQTRVSFARDDERGTWLIHNDIAHNPRAHPRAVGDGRRGPLTPAVLAVRCAVPSVTRLAPRARVTVHMRQ